MKRRVALECLKPGCPRKMVLTGDSIDETIPKQAVMIKSYCPWHEKSGGKDYPESYFNKDGRELDWETGEPL